MNRQELELCLEAGFIDFNINNDERFLPKILTNNQQRQVKVLENLLYELRHCDDFFFSVAFVTNSGVACLIDILEELKERNIKGRILASQYQNFTEPRALRRLLQFPNLQLKIITSDYNFHAKGYLFHHLPDKDGTDNYTMIVGSSNLTQNALTVNREWNVQLSSMKNGALVRQMREELQHAWEDAEQVDEAWISAYEKIYREASSLRGKSRSKIIDLYRVNPNKMQVQALEGIERLRAEGKNRALLISATGTGKTYLSAFDVRTVRPGRCLFIVHRGLIARKAKESFERIIDRGISTGLFTGTCKEIDARYLFATVQTLAAGDNLHAFAPDDFDYIIIDEVHRAGAPTYQKILNYFQPEFLLGMTATPERTDGYDIFKVFDYNIAYEIRLNQALEENMLVPFHYHGISEIEIDGRVLDDNAQFRYLVCGQRVEHILKYADFYGCDQGRVKGLVFCSRTEEAEELALAFNRKGRRAAALTGSSTESERAAAVARLESDDLPEAEQLEYIFTVDIFNEGVDIPSVNQIIMLRPTQSAIIFVQQLGRGLRKNGGKRYLEVIDFIGNYANNYLLPIALYGDRSYNREKLRRIMHSNFLPGASTVYFTDVLKQQIYKSINTGRLTQMKEYKNSYELVKFKIGHKPMMMDFVRLGDKDPYLFVQKKKSYFNFRQAVDHEETSLGQQHEKVLQMISIEIANGKRPEEIALLQLLLKKQRTYTEEFRKYFAAEFGFDITDAALAGAVNVLTLSFFKDADAVKYGGQPLIEIDNGSIALSGEFTELLANAEFRSYVEDALAYGKYRFLENYDPENYFYGFKLYETYSRKDACRILNWQKDESSTVYGYRVKYGTCPMFVTYNKQEQISASTQYEDRFLTPRLFSWMTRSRINLESAEVEAIRKKETLKLLFIKKSDDDGTEFYFMGAAQLQKEPILTSIMDDKGRKLPIVNIIYRMDRTVDEKIYSYFEE